MIDTEALRKKVIDLAIQGKLTEQLPSDGDAGTLYAQIQEEKAKLIKEGKIKKEKALPEIADEEIPFAIPKNWKWIRWGDLSEKIQYGYNAPAKSSGRIKMVRISDIQDGKVQWNDVPYCDIEEDSIKEYLLRKNDILFARTGGTVGKSYIVSDIPEEAVFAGYLIRTSYSSDIYSPYMKYFMESGLYWKQLQNGTIATAQPNCNGKTLSKMIVPFPPYAEQRRISEKVDDILAQVDIIDDLQAKYSNDLAILRNRIIDAGIQGKLVKQCLKNEKQSSKFSGRAITDDEKWCLSPESWNWTTLSSITTPDTLNDGNWVLSADMVPDGEVKLIQLGSIGDCEYRYKGFKYLTVEHFAELNGRQIYPGYLLVNRLVVDKMLSCIIPDIDGILMTAVDVCWIAPNPDIYDIKYLMYVLTSSGFQQRVKELGHGVTRFRISKNNLIDIPIPFPPLEEQIRIVEKIEELISLQ